MLKIASVLILLIVCSFSVAKDLPSYIKTCKRHDLKLNECFAKNANIAIAGFAKGDPDYKIPPLAPYKWKTNIQFNAPNLEFYFLDSVVTGVENLTVAEANIDLDKKLIQFYFNSELMIWKGHYKAQIEEDNTKKEKTGSVDIFITNGKFLMTFEYEIQTIKGTEYAKLTSAKETIKSVDISFKPDESDKNGLNNNEWEALKKTLFDEEMLKKTAAAVGRFISNIFDVVPYNNIFPE